MEPLRIPGFRVLETGETGETYAIFHIYFISLMNSYNNNQKEVLRLVYSLASIHNTQFVADQTIQFVKENWGKFRADYESTLTRKRFSTGYHERGLFKHVADVCDWKTNKKYMRIASQIMILCGYHSYEKENRFKQKIQNILKKSRKN